MNTKELQGLVELTNEEYHAAPGISNSHLSTMARSPLHYWDRYINPNREPEKQTENLKVGSATHTAILEPDLFDERYAVAPQVDRRTKEGKAAYAAFEAENLGKEILTAENYDLCMRMRDAVHAHPEAAALLSKGKREQSFFANHPETGELIKCRTDWMPDTGGLIVDLKTTVDASPTGFAREVANLGYFRQAPWYSDIVRMVTGTAHHFAFIAVEKNRPHAVAVYYLSDDDMEFGRRECRRLLELIIQCKRTNQWPGYVTKATQLTLPTWLKKQMEDAA